MLPDRVRYDIDEICDCVSNGGTLTQYCRDRELPFGAVHAYVFRHPERKKQYNEALLSRGDLIVQNVVATTLRMAAFDPATIVDQSGGLKPVSEWPAEARAACEQLTFGENNQLRNVRFVKRLAVMDMLAKWHWKFKDGPEKESAVSLTDLIVEVSGGKKRDG